MEHKNITLEEFEKAFKSVKHNKAAGHDDIDSNVIIKVYDEFSDPLFMIFHSSFNEVIFPEQLAGLPIFSKVLDRIMYNSAYQYFKENDVFLKIIWLSSK